MDFYYMNPSAPCRSVMLTAKSVGVELNKKTINLMEGEQMKPDFLAINFQHCVPTLVDGDLKLWESRAICTYLASEYGKDESLYPKCPKHRAMVDRLLYFDMSFYSTVRAYVFPIIRLGEKADPTKIEKIQDSVGDLNTFLEGHDYAAGDKITVADHCLVATVASIDAIGIDISKHSNVVAWFERCKKNIPGYESECGAGAAQFGNMVKSKLA